VHGDRIESPDTLGRKCWAFAYNTFMYARAHTALELALRALTPALVAGGGVSRLRCSKRWLPTLSMCVLAPCAPRGACCLCDDCCLFDDASHPAHVRFFAEAMEGAVPFTMQVMLHFLLFRAAACLAHNPPLTPNAHSPSAVRARYGELLRQFLLRPLAQRNLPLEGVLPPPPVMAAPRGACPSLFAQHVCACMKIL
jgi:hypothetical protein